MPWNELLSNLAIVALASSIWTAGYGAIARQPKVWQQISLGSLMGVATLLSMLLPFQFIPGVFVDLRYTLIAVSAFFGGPLAACIPVTVAVTRRLMLGGTGIWVALPNIAMALGFGLLGHYLTKRRGISTSAIWILAMSVVISGTLGFFVMMPVQKWAFALTAVVTPFGLLLFLSTFFSALAISHEIKRQGTLKENWTYRAVIDALPDCLNAKDLNGKFIAANPATAGLMGADGVKSLLGKTDFEFYGSETAAGFQRREINQTSSGEANIFEEEIVRPDGKTVWLSTLKAPFRDVSGNVIGVITHNREITDRKRLELSLADTQRDLADALAGMADGLALFNADRILVFHNDRYSAMFPLTSDVRIPGSSLPSIIAMSLERGEVADAAETVSDIVGQLTAESGTRLIRMADGRQLQARTRMTANGGSMVMFSDVTKSMRAEKELRELNEKLLALSNTDGLTGLMNRRAFDARLRDAIEEAGSSHHDVGFLMIDVDKFKVFNDTHGHPAGDECLRLVSQCLIQVTAGLLGVTVGRYGGEEFGIILPRLSVVESTHVGKLVMSAVRQLGEGDELDPMSPVTVSVGVAALLSGDANNGGLLVRADAALYRAKAAGRDCIRISDETGPGRQVF